MKNYTIYENKWESNWQPSFPLVRLDLEDAGDVIEAKPWNASYQNRIKTATHNIEFAYATAEPVRLRYSGVWCLSGRPLDLNVSSWRKLMRPFSRVSGAYLTPDCNATALALYEQVWRRRRIRGMTKLVGRSVSLASTLTVIRRPQEKPTPDHFYALSCTLAVLPVFSRLRHVYGFARSLPRKEYDCMAANCTSILPFYAITGTASGRHALYLVWTHYDGSNRWSWRYMRLGGAKDFDTMVAKAQEIQTKLLLGLLDSVDPVFQSIRMSRFWKLHPTRMTQEETKALLFEFAREQTREFYSDVGRAANGQGHPLNLLSLQLGRRQLLSSEGHLMSPAEIKKELRIALALLNEAIGRKAK